MGNMWIGKGEHGIGNEEWGEEKRGGVWMLKKWWEGWGWGKGGGNRRRARLAAETENTLLVGTSRLEGVYDRAEYDREEVLERALQAWRMDPLARRIIELTTQYVTGGGLALRCDPADGPAAAFLKRWWEHPLNRIEQYAGEWCDELSRAGELFILLSTDAGGMSYVRAVPAAQIPAVRTAPGDVQQELSCLERGAQAGEEREWPVYDPQNDAPDGEQGGFAAAMLHFAINRPVGAVRGESDLAPLLRWLNRYAGWLEDRVRLNRWRTTFAYVVKQRFASEEERSQRQQALTGGAPPPGSILVVDESESWEVIAPKLESQEAGEDGLALKRMIAAGAGVPLHFLAEPEGSTRTTAESAGGPAYRRFEQRQRFFCGMLADLARAALRRRELATGDRLEGDVRIDGGDLSARDNAEMAAAAKAASEALAGLYDRQLIGEDEVRRLVYRFLGETAPR
jgi:hypothetical protein